MNRQRIISLALTLLFLLLGAILFRTLKLKKESTIATENPEVELRKVTVSNFIPGPASNAIDIDGRVTAYEKINLAAEVQGKLLSIDKLYRQGSHFDKGELLFQIDSRDDVFSLKAQRSLLFNAITQIMPDLKFDYPESFDKWKRYLDAFDLEKNVKRLPEVNSDKEKYYIGGKNIYNLYYTIKSLEEKLINYNIYAPFRGVFLSVNSYPGALVSPGVTLGQVMNTSNLELVSPVALADLKYLKIGQKVALFSDELNKEFSGRISRISRQLDATTQSIPVYITLTGTGLRDGMYLRGSISGSSIEKIAVIPKDILVNNNQVFTYQDSGLELKTIELVKLSAEQAFVRGLSGEERVVISATNNLYEGQKVNI